MLALNVRQTGRPVLLPNGREYCAELAKNQKEQDACTGDLEDALYNSNRRAERQVRTVENFVTREKLRRNPCGAIKRIFQPGACKSP